MSNLVELVPEASNLIESQRSVGYTFETAIADIIDNSVSAKAKNVDVIFDNEERFVSIIDDGIGMYSDELIQAMRYGSKSVYDVRSKDDLGRFGLGLKMASFSQCRKLSVISKKAGAISGAIWDLDLIKEQNSWVIKILNPTEIFSNRFIEKLKKISSGTIVIWEKFDKFEQHSDFEKNFDESLDRAENHLSLVYHRYLQNKELIIRFNGREIDFVDPFFSTNKATQPKSKDYIFESNRNSKIEVKPFIVPYKSKLTQKEKHILQKYEQHQLNPGLYIYRNRRLIAWGKWFRLVKSNELANLAKIMVDIPNNMDDLWGIDVKKSQINIPISVRTQLINIIKRSIGESERVYKFKGTKRNRGNLQYIFDRVEKENVISYKINYEHPLIVQLQNNLSDSDNYMLSKLLQHIENYLPLESIQYDMASNRTIEKNEDSEDEMYEEIMLLLDNQSTLQSKKDFLEKIKNIESYSKQTKVINKIERELK